jgi:hypothetical protein
MFSVGSETGSETFYWSSRIRIRKKIASDPQHWLAENLWLDFLLRMMEKLKKYKEEKKKLEEMKKKQQNKPVFKVGILIPVGT